MLGTDWAASVLVTVVALGLQVSARGEALQEVRVARLVLGWVALVWVLVLVLLQVVA